MQKLLLLSFGECKVQCQLQKNVLYANFEDVGDCIMSLRFGE